MRSSGIRRLGAAAGVALLAGFIAAHERPAGAQERPAPAPPPEGQAPAQPAPADDPQQPVFRTGINFVRVDVIVTDKQGQPVTDLTAGDFEVQEDGRPQAIETFRLVKIDEFQPTETTTRAIRSRGDEEAAAANEDARIFVFFLDDYHVRRGNSMAARQPLADFVRNSLAPTDLVAVMYPLSPLDTVTLTRDHASVVRMLERFEGRKFDYEPKNSIEERYSMYPAEVVERIRRQVALSALEGLSVKLGALREGRKAVILVSEGYTSLLPPQLRDPVAGMPGIGNPARFNPLAGENSALEDRARWLGDMDVQRELRDVFDAANRNNTAIYAVDPRGLATGEFDIADNVGMRQSQDAMRQTMDTLRVLAAETDGRAIVNRNDLGKAMQQIVRDSSAYYLIGYNSTQAPQDGKFHEIKVRVKRPNTQVRARKGYWALTSEEAARATAPAAEGPPPDVTRALADLAEPTRGRYVHSWIGAAPADDGRTTMTLVWESIPVPPGTRREVATHVEVMASASDGRLVYRGRVPEDGAATDASVRAGGRVSFDAVPGRLSLRLSVRNANGTLDAEDRTIVVPDLTGPEVTLGTPRVHVARNAFEYQQIRKDPDATPTATRDFRRTERLLVRADAFGPGGAPVDVSSRLLNKQGQKMTDLPVTAPGGDGQPHVVDLPLSSLPPGEYLLELAAATDGQEPVRALVAFRVGS